MPDYDMEWEMAGVIGALQNKLGYEFEDPAALAAVCFPVTEPEKKRFRHLRQVGDKVYTIIMSRQYFETFEDLKGDSMVNVLGEVTSNKFLNQAASARDLRRYILRFPEEGDRLSDSVQALVGALYVDGGYEAAKKFVADNFLFYAPRK